jgi:phage recombination protein Bet
MGERTTELVPANAPGALAQYNWTREQIDLIKRTVAKDTSDDELALFMHVCKRTGLDPLARQIYAIVRRSKDKNGDWVKTMVLQTGIDGLRLQAERTGKFRGFGPTEWCGDDGVWKDVWLRLDAPPSAARVAVLRVDAPDGDPVSIQGIALYREYVQTNQSGAPTQRWASGPAGQLAKCAEALALRRAFPAELAGLFAHEEMAQGDNPPDAPKVQQPKRKSESASAGPNYCPPASPWEGDIDDIKKSGTANLWALHAEQGTIRFLTDQEEIKDRAAEAMSNAKAVRIEWVQAKAGHAQVQTLVALQDA